MVICRRVGVVLAMAANATEGATQQVLMVDMNAGRRLAGGAEYSFGLAVAVDYGRRLVLVNEASDPLAVIAYSLDDGSVQDVFGGGRAGDGPGELKQVYATAAGPHGVLVSGPGRVIHWSWSDTLLHQWTPAAPRTEALCVWNGRATVAAQQGVVYRGDGGESVAVGGEASRRLQSEENWTSFMAALNAYSATLLACDGKSAYVLDGYRHVLTAYGMDATSRAVALPAAAVDLARKIMAREIGPDTFTPGYNNLFLSDDGQIVIQTAGLFETAGVVIDPETECYALLQHEPHPPGWDYVGMFSDSVVTLEGSRRPMRRTVNGRPVPVFDPTRTHIFVRPVRAVSGEPCS